MKLILSYLQFLTSLQHSSSTQLTFKQHSSATRIKLSHSLSISHVFLKPTLDSHDLQVTIKQKKSKYYSEHQSRISTTALKQISTIAYIKTSPSSSPQVLTFQKSIAKQNLNFLVEINAVWIILSSGPSSSFQTHVISSLSQNMTHTQNKLLLLLLIQWNHH